MYQVAIIGAGQLGSRHLQGLKIASSPLFITVMDNNEDSLRIAKERYDAVSIIGEKSIQFVKSIDDLPDYLDLVIIATSAKPRAIIIKNLLNRTRVRYMILEKVLFTQLSDYDEIRELLKENNVCCWVNCPRRMFGSYSLIKNRIDYTSPIKMKFIGQNWGLCCNSMHFIDVFMFLTQEDSYSLNTDEIEPIIIESKRSGYIEMNGTLHIKTKQGNELILSCTPSNQNGIVEIKNDLNHFALDEVNGLLTIDKQDIKIDTPFQSQTTGILADSILRTGFCPLSSYEKSSQYHKIFIAKMLNKYNKITMGDSKILPIT